jgi:orotidine-5'-phosphate decarboxylase
VTETARPLSARERLILAVDTPTVDEARRIIDELYDYVGVFKIGLEMLMNEGPQVLKVFQERDLRVFFDGKFLDIPNTVAKATEAVARAGVDMFTVHATGGRKMLEACVLACRNAATSAGKREPIILGVTVLTSMDQAALNGELRVPGTVTEQVVNLAGLCAASGITGIVASPAEVAQIRAVVGSKLVLVTPGVRPTWADANDQSRVMTPTEALSAGADYLVIGRPITGAPNRKEAAKKIVDEMDAATAAV